MRTAAAIALALAGCGGGGGGGGKEEANMATLLVRNACAHSGGIHEICQLWYRPCKSYWDKYLHSRIYYRDQEGAWIPIELPWWEPEPFNPRPAGPMLWPGEEVIAGEVPEGGYEFLWCRGDTWLGGSPGDAGQCPGGYDGLPPLGNDCLIVLVVHDDMTVVEIEP